MLDPERLIHENPEFVVRLLKEAFQDWDKLEIFIHQQEMDSDYLYLLGYIENETDRRFVDIVIAWAKWKEAQRSNLACIIKVKREQPL